MTIDQAVAKALGKGPDYMLWNEAFRRATNCLVWLVIWSLVAESVLVAGVAFIGWGVQDFEARKAGLALGVGMVMGGGAMMILTGMAVWIKASTDSVADHVVRRMTAKLRDLPSEVPASYRPNDVSINDHSTNGHGTSGHNSNDHGANGNGTSGNNTNGHSTNGHGTNDRSLDGSHDATHASA